MHWRDNMTSRWECGAIALCSSLHMETRIPKTRDGPSGSGLEIRRNTSLFSISYGFPFALYLGRVLYLRTWGNKTRKGQQRVRSSKSATKTLGLENLPRV
ncbi:hypothetical protein J3458_001447 [Metarhizium acridum]|uniref:uncharacterized protein n=1 Tax=Metarhizium acridum TaxID=92637 RepID=UPI001C6BDD6F|nr:hypothetical protein J3458_001447 [Metarhizium acridum]